MASESEATSSTSSDPNLAVIWSFLEVFGEKCALENISISQLIHMIEDTQEVAAPLRDLHVKLLRRAVKSFSAERWEKCLTKFCHQLGSHQEGWELERFGYKKANWQVKLSVLKKLLEYQFTCNSKFKTAVNQISSEDLRLNPVGRDKKGRSYWLHTDHRGNLRLYREDHDEETWVLIASDRDGLASVIQQLKSGESPTHSVTEPILNEDSNSVEDAASKDSLQDPDSTKDELNKNEETMPTKEQAPKNEDENSQAPKDEDEDENNQAPKDEENSQPHKDEYENSQAPKDEENSQPHKDEYENSQAPKDEVNSQAPKEEVNSQAPKEEVNNQAPKEEVNNQAPIDEENRQTPKDEANSQPHKDEYENSHAPKDEANSHAPKDEEKSHPPKDEANSHAPKDEKNSQTPEDEVNNQAPKDEDGNSQTASDKDNRITHPDVNIGEVSGELSREEKGAEGIDELEHKDETHLKDEETAEEQSTDKLGNDHVIDNVKQKEDDVDMEKANSASLEGKVSGICNPLPAHDSEDAGKLEAVDRKADDGALRDDSSITEDTQIATIVTGDNLSKSCDQDIESVKSDDIQKAEENIKDIQSDQGEKAECASSSITSEVSESKRERETESGEDSTSDSPSAKKSKKDSGESIPEDERVIEENVMIITGEGEGAECEGVYFSEEITEDVMYVYGEGWGADCCTGNPTLGETEDSTNTGTNGEEQGQSPAPLPVTKRFLHKSQSDNESSAKTKLWSVDSLCSKPSTSESHREETTHQSDSKTEAAIEDDKPTAAINNNGGSNSNSGSGDPPANLAASVNEHETKSNCNNKARDSSIKPEKSTDEEKRDSVSSATNRLNHKSNKAETPTLIADTKGKTGQKDGNDSVESTKAKCSNDNNVTNCDNNTPVAIKGGARKKSGRDAANKIKANPRNKSTESVDNDNNGIETTVATGNGKTSLNKSKGRLKKKDATQSKNANLEKSDTDSYVSTHESKLRKHKAVENVDVDESITSDDISDSHVPEIHLKKPKLSSGNVMEEDPLLIPSDDRIEEPKEANLNSSPSENPKRKCSIGSRKIKDLAKVVDAISSRIKSDKSVKEKMADANEAQKNIEKKTKKKKVEITVKKVSQKICKIGNVTIKPMPVKPVASKKTKIQSMKTKETVKKCEKPVKNSKSAPPNHSESESDEPLTVKRNKRTDSPKGKPANTDTKKAKTTNSVSKKNAAPNKTPGAEKEEKDKIKVVPKNARKRGYQETESLSEEDGGESLQSKRLKMKPKKANKTNLRKKAEERKLIEESSSEEETEPPVKSGKMKRNSKTPPSATKKSTPASTKPKKASKKKPKTNVESDVDDLPVVLKTPKLEEDTPVRQSRRIAQLKIREEAQRRLMEEVALRELKAKHKKNKSKDADWKGSESEHSSDDPLVKGKKKKSIKKKNEWSKKIGWHTSNSESSDDSEIEDDIEEREPEEDVLAIRSDHEFSPESEVEGESAPVRRARTRQEGGAVTDEGCVSCNGNDHPEWILLCDACDAGWHASCLKPMLFSVPEGDWFCPPCSQVKLVDALTRKLEEYDQKLKTIKIEDLERKEKEEREALEKPNNVATKSEQSESDGSSMSTDEDEDTSDSGKIYRLRERRQLPISYHFKEYDQLISSALKEEYKEVDNSSAGNQGRGKDISTIINADKEEKKALLEATLRDEEKNEEEKKEAAAAIEESVRRISIKSRKKPRKLNSLDVVSDDADDNSDEDFKETGWSTSSSEASESESEGSKSSHSSDSLPIRRSQRAGTKKVKKKIVDSPDRSKKKSKRFEDETSSEASDEKDWSTAHKKKKKASGSRRSTFRIKEKSSRKKKKRPKRSDGEEEKQPRAKVRYGGLSDSSAESHDWSPAHRTRQRKVNYTEMPNTESEDEMHKPSGKHMDSSDEYKVESDSDSDSSDLKKKKKDSDEEEVSILKAFMEGTRGKPEAANNTCSSPQVPTTPTPTTTTTTPVKVEHMNPVVKLSDISPIKIAGHNAGPIIKESDELSPTMTSPGDTSSDQGGRGRGSRGGRGRGSRGSYRPRGTSPKGRGGRLGTAHLIGAGIVSPKDGESLEAGNEVVDAEREKKRIEKEAKLLEKQKKIEERLKKKEEKIQIKEQKAKEREEKKLAKIQDKEQKKMNKQVKSDHLSTPININRPLQFAPGVGPPSMMGPGGPIRPPFMGQHFPRGQIDFRNELRQPGMLPGEFPRPHMDPRMSMAGDPRMSAMPGNVRMAGEQRLNDPRMSVPNNLRMLSPGEHRMPVPSEPRMPLANESRMPVPGNTRMPIHSDSRMPFSGDSRMPFPGDSRMPFPGDSRMPFPGDSRMPFAGDPRMGGPVPNSDPRLSVAGNLRLPSEPRQTPSSDLRLLNTPRMPFPSDLRMPMGDPRMHSAPDNRMPMDTKQSMMSYADKPLAPGYMLDSRGMPVPGGMDLGVPRPSPPKRRGRGPGKKTLARQAAAAGTDGTGPNPPMAEGTLAIAGAPQPFRPAVEEPSIITRMPHMMPTPYRGGYGGPNVMYGGPRGPHMYRSPHPMDPSPSGGGPISVGSPQPYYHPRYMGPQDQKEDNKPSEGHVQEIKSEPGTIQIKKSLSPEASPTHEESAEEDTKSNCSAPAVSPPPSKSHPQLKHTEAKGERARGRIALTAATRFPQGPYAPQYNPYPPYPPPHDAPHYPPHATHHQAMGPHPRPPYPQYPSHGMPPQHHAPPPSHHPHGPPPPLHHAPPTASSPHNIHPHVAQSNPSPHGPHPHSPHGPPPPHSPHGPPPPHGTPPTHSPHALGRPSPYGPPHYPPSAYHPHHPSYRPPYGMPHHQSPVPPPSNVPPHKPSPVADSQNSIKDSSQLSPAKETPDSHHKEKSETKSEPVSPPKDDDSNSNDKTSPQGDKAPHAVPLDPSSVVVKSEPAPVVIKAEHPLEHPALQKSAAPITQHMPQNYPQSPIRHTTPSPHPPASPSPHPRPPSAHHPPLTAHHPPPTAHHPPSTPHMPSPAHHPPLSHHMMPPYHPHGPPPPLVQPPPSHHPAVEPSPPNRQPEEDSGEFGGLVSYFSSQREDDIDS